MNYCTIQEAWGKENYISNQYKKYNSPEENYAIEKKPIENFSNIPQKIRKKKEYFHNTKKQMNKNINYNEENSCNDFITHLKTCRQCQIKLREQFRPKILENFEDIIQTNRDLIVLILVGMSLLLFFRLLTSVSSDDKK
jgi:flagellar biosynthesis chaperone FliJ